MPNSMFFLLFVVLVGFAFVVHRLRALEQSIAKTFDLSGAHTRLEEVLAKLRRVEAMEQNVAILQAGMSSMPGALLAIGRKIDHAFEKFEESTLPEEAKLGNRTLSRIANARALMEKEEAESLRQFNDSIENGGRAGKLTPIVARGGL